jgi:branched-chain amino acid transport system substrate-binding protein
MTRTVKLVAALLVMALAAFLAAGCGSKEATTKEEVKEVKLGGIFDLTGGTGDVGVPYAAGVKAYVDWINSKGGINGRQVDLIGIDYAYQIDRAVEAYNKLTGQDKVPAILGWGTGDTEKMVAFISRDKIPYMSASYSENLLRIEDHPYNFLIAASYSDQAKVALKWIKENYKGTPKVALIFNDTGFGRSPVDDAKKFAAEIGVDIVDEQIVDLKALDATSQLLNMNKKGVTHAIIQETSNATSTILKDAKKLGLKTQFIGLNWAADEICLGLAKEAAEGYIGVIPFAFPYEDVPGMKNVEEAFAKQGKKLNELTQKHVQGFVSTMVILEGYKRAGDNLTGEGIAKALEGIQNFDTGGLCAPVGFSKESHRGSAKVKLAQVKNGKWEPITGWISYK